MLKQFSKILLSLSLLATAPFVSADIEGTWQGTLVTAPGAALVVQFIIKPKEDGTYSLLLNFNVFSAATSSLHPLA